MDHNQFVPWVLALIIIVSLGVAAATIDSSSLPRNDETDGTGGPGDGGGIISLERGPFFGFDEDGGEVNQSEGPDGQGIGGEGQQDGGETIPDSLSPSTPTLVVIVALIALVLVIAVVVRRTVDNDSTPEPAPGASNGNVAAIGHTAGRAADRIATSTDPTNEIYRTWVEMTHHLDVADPETSTPAEFAAAAVDAGLRHEDVAELTELFTIVRYGGRSVTAEREERAVAALHRIEITDQEDDA